MTVPLEEIARLRGLNRAGEAFEACCEILADDPGCAGAHAAGLDLIAGMAPPPMDAAAFNRVHASDALKQAYIAGIGRMQMEGRSGDAVVWAENLCALDPRHGEYPIVLGMVALAAGQNDKALDAFMRGLALDPANIYYRAAFVRALRMTRFDGFDPRVKDWVVLFLREPESVPVDSLAPLWRDLLRRDPGMGPVRHALALRDDAAFDAWAAGLAPGGDAACLLDPFVLEGLRCFIVADRDYEIMLTRLRRFFLNRAAEAPDGGAFAWALPVAAALADQCFLTEYVYAETAGETAAVNRLAALRDPPPFTVAVLAAYRSLAGLDNARRASGGRALASVVRRQIDEPAEEERLKGRIPSLAPIGDDVSQRVRAQYEENPYPRWISMGRAQLMHDPAVAGLQAFLGASEILVAGCGTGSQTVGVCFRHPGAKVTGIDLSLASLGYAARKAREAGIENLTLIQADILDAGRPGKSFDLIECGGVLHHMRDPEAGWRVLCGILKRGGLMRIALYSTLARRHIAEAQEDIRRAGLAPTPETIRRYRQDLYRLPPDHPYQDFMKSEDFFSLSMVRDALFHVQEHTFDLKRIEKDLAELGLRFIGFSGLLPATRRRYAEMFPDDAAMTRLDHWDAFERRFPDTFIGMYDFWCVRTG